MLPPDQIGARVRQAREYRNISRDSLAEAIGVRGGTIQKWEVEGAVPRADSLALTAEALRVPLAWLLGVNEMGFQAPPLPRGKSAVRSRKSG